MKACRTTIIFCACIIAASALPLSPHAVADRPLDRRGAELLEAALKQKIAAMTVMLSVEPQQIGAALEKLKAAGATVSHLDAELGYLRIQIAPALVNELRAWPLLEVVDLGNYGDQPWHPLAAPPPPAPSPATAQSAPGPSEPLVSPAQFSLEARAMGVDQFRARHPKFDGRGVTIAVIDGTPDLLSPHLQQAIALDGRRLPKFADVIVANNPLEEADPFWVKMSAAATAREQRLEYQGKSYVTPADKTYRIGVFDERSLHGRLQNDINRDSNPPDSSGEFAVLWDEAAATVWVDTNQNLRFDDEQPLKEYHERAEIGRFGTDNPATPLRESIGFTVQLEAAKKFVHLTLGAGDHGTAVAGAAAGHDFPGKNNVAAASGAQLISIRQSNGEHGVLEALILAAKDPRVDIIANASGTMIKDWLLARRVLGRLMAKHPKPIFISAGNSTGFNIISSYATPPEIMAVSGYQSQAGWLANYGAQVARPDNMLYATSFGPGVDGLFKPDLIAPSGSLGLWPGHLPGGSLKGLFRLPPGYTVFSGTSCAAPMAASAAALLVSAAKQTGVAYDAQRLYHALRATARFLPDVESYRQGAGLLQVEAAWSELQALARTGGPVRIVSQGPVKTVESFALDPPHRGVGLFEREGWRAGQREQRTIQFTRLSGMKGTQTFEVSWAGNDGTFSSLQQVRLPLGTPVKLPVTVHPQTSGAHSAILDLREPGTRRIVHRMMSTVVAAEQLAELPGHTFRQTVSVNRPDTTLAFFAVPPGAEVLRVEIEVPDDGLVVYVQSPSRYYRPRNSQVEKKRWAESFESPEPGVWEVILRNAPDGRGFDQSRPKPLPPTPVTLTVSLTRAPGAEANRTQR